ncbi:acyltransferase [Streptomyces laurentii]|uniref:Acyltransferase n=1 Tax=Streptomyces laurentii TaxID=39478 RepID=A0A160P6J8_STRLU|nr:acyltransferase [Streptomyces laurentii]
MSQLAPPVQSSAPAPAAPPERAAYFDNAKLLAVVLVVCGHFWEPLIDQPGQRVAKALYLLVYAFHMPAFILISGFFSRSFTAQPRQMRRLVSGVLVPFLIWGILLAYFTGAVNDKSVSIQPLTPVWVTWFLIALFLWRLSVPLWRNLRAPVTVATLVFLAAGAFSLGAQLSVTRVLQFLPYFVLGLTLDPRHLAWLRETRWVKGAAVAVFVVAGAAAYKVAPDLEAVWLYRSKGAPELHVGYAQWLLEAGVVFVAGLVLTAAFLALVPARRAWFTSLGAGTMGAFLLHAFIRQGAFAAGFFDHPFVRGLPGLAALTVLCVALSLLLCTRPVQFLLRPLVEPRLNWLFHPEESTRVTGSHRRK